MVYLKRWTSFFETFPVRPNRSIEFWTEISGNFVWMDRANLMLALHEINANINNLRSFSRVNFLKRLFPRCFHYLDTLLTFYYFKRSICFIGAKIRHNQWNCEEPSNWPFVRLGKVYTGGGGGVLGFMFAGYVLLASQKDLHYQWHWPGSYFFK